MKKSEIISEGMSVDNFKGIPEEIFEGLSNYFFLRIIYKAINQVEFLKEHMESYLKLFMK